MSKKKKRLIAGLVCLIFIFSSFHLADFFNASDSDVESGIESETLIGGETTENMAVTEAATEDTESVTEVSGTEDPTVTESTEAEVTEDVTEEETEEETEKPEENPSGDTAEASTEADTGDNTAESKTEITAVGVFSREIPYETLTKDEKREFYKKMLQNENDRTKFLKLSDSEVISCFSMTREDLQKEASELLLKETYNSWLAGLEEKDVMVIFGDTELYASVFGETPENEEIFEASEEISGEITTETVTESTTETVSEETSEEITTETTTETVTETVTEAATESVSEEITTETTEEPEDATVGNAATGTPTDAAEGGIFDMLSLFTADMPMLLAGANGDVSYGFRFSANGGDDLTVECINMDHPAKAVITSASHNGKYIHCADRYKTSAFQWTNAAWHSNNRYWSLTTVNNAMANVLFDYYLGADPNGSGNQKSDSEYLQLTYDLTPLRNTDSSARTAATTASFTVKNGSTNVNSQTIKASYDNNGVQKTPTLTFSTGSYCIYHKVTVPAGVTINYLRGGNWNTATGSAILADGEKAYFSVPAGSSVTDVSVSTRSVRSDGSDGYYIGNQYLLTPEFTVTNSSGSTVTLQTFMFCDGETASASFNLQFTAYGSVYLEKTSANPSFSDGCGIYTTKGIEYTVYSDAARTVPAKAFKRNDDGSFSNTDPKFVIGDNNKSNALYFPIGVKYYYKETKTNDYFAMDTSPASKQNFTLAEGNAVSADVQIVPNNALKLSEQDSPVSDPVGLQLSKTDSEGITVANTTGANPDTFTGPDLSGAVFRMDYYNDYYDTVNADGSIPGAAPESTWYFQTKLNAATGEYRFAYTESFLAPGYTSSAIKYNDEGFAALPLGTVVMYEVNPPQGYNNAGAMINAAGAVDNQVFIGQVRPDGKGRARTFVRGTGDSAFETNQSGQQVRVFTTAQAGTPVALAEEVTRVGFSVTKIDHVTYEEMEDVFFRVTSSTGESHYIKTGSKGFYSSEGVPHSRYTNAYDRLFDNDPSNDTIDGVNIAELDCGLWFYGTADESEWTTDKIDDTKMACRYDEALVFTEIVTDANRGKQMIVDFTVSLTEPNVIKNLGVWTNVPDIQLSSLESDAFTGTHASVPGTETVIKDIVSYKYLTAGKTFTLKGIIMELLEDGSVTPLMDAQGNLIRSNEVFTVDSSFVKTAQEKCGDVTVTFSFDGSNLAGKSFVVYEYLFDGESDALIEVDGDEVKTDGAKLNTAGEVISHADSGDENQTGVFYSLKTYASGKSGANIAEISKSTEITDSVYCTGLDTGFEYRLDGALKYVDRQGQIKDILDKEGNPLTVSKHFISENGNDVVEMIFPAFDGTQLLDENGKLITDGIVVYEKLYWNDTLLVSHEDINDKDQTVFIPEIGTTATSESGTKTVYSKKDVTIIDKVSYRNFIIGKKYTVQGIAMDPATGMPYLDENGAEITAETTFTAETADGSVDVTFTFDAVSLSGSTIVIFEHMYHNGVEIAAHTDIEDEDQTVYVAKISTTARDESTGMQNGVISDKAVIIDTVSYENLEIGKNHTVIGYLMDNETGKLFMNGIFPVMATEVFTPQAKEGSVDVRFEFDSSSLEGHELVVFEYVYTDDSEEPVATHEDINSVSQTVSYPELKTTARDASTGTNKGKVAETVTIIDTVSYTNLIIGKKYTVKGILMDHATGEPYTVNGKTVTAEKTFTAETSDGFIEIEFTFDGSALEGKSIVVFENLYHEGIEVGSHADLEDEGQTIDFPPSGPPHTGDRSPVVPVVIAMLFALGGIVIAIRVRSKKKD